MTDKYYKLIILVMFSKLNNKLKLKMIKPKMHEYKELNFVMVI